MRQVNGTLLVTLAVCALVAGCESGSSEGPPPIEFTPPPPPTR